MENKDFKGNNFNIEQGKRLGTLKTLAENICKNNKLFRLADDDQPTRNKPHATVGIVFPRLTFLDHEQTVKELGKMFEIADDFFMAPISDGIRLTWAIRNVWEEK